MPHPDRPVVIVGAGLAGLNCAVRLQQAGIAVRVLDASDHAGGRLRTDTVEGFRLDRGFQVLLTAYPEAALALDLPALELQRFPAGANVFFNRRFHRVRDPWREPAAWPASLFSAVGNLFDKLRLALLRSRVLRGEAERCFDRDDGAIYAHLQRLGFSHMIRQRFFQPFFGGVTLDPRLDGSSRLFEYLFRMLAQGEAAVPAGGMGAIADQLSSRLPEGALWMGARVERVREAEVELAGGRTLAARAVVVAADASGAARLLGTPEPQWNGCTCYWLTCVGEWPGGKALVLNGEGHGPVNHLAVLSAVNPGCAPCGQSLVAATVLRPERWRAGALEPAIHEQLGRWYGRDLPAYRVLRVDTLPQALPRLPLGQFCSPQRVPPRVSPGVYVCGDHTSLPAIQGALLSGRLAAEAVAQDLSAAG